MIFQVNFQAVFFCAKNYKQNTSFYLGSLYASQHDYINTNFVAPKYGFQNEGVEACFTQVMTHQIWIALFDMTLTRLLYYFLERKTGGCPPPVK